MLNRKVSAPFWGKFISERSGNTVRLLKRFPAKHLSIRELRLLDELFEEFEEYDEFQIRDYCHALPEYKNPGRSRIPILVEDILRALKKPETVILRIEAEEESLAEIRRFAVT